MDEADFIAISGACYNNHTFFILEQEQRVKMENRSDIIDYSDVSNLFSKINILFI
jgi:hypothetical protein